MNYAFTLDASACSGCKACQAACKDKNNLPVGVFWRKVIEVSGGEWQPKNDTWTNNVFAYNLSIACNHCVHPKCAGVCPTNAYHVRDDGVVLLDQEKCVGCGYCNWACPYAVPQYDREAGVMTKCNFCFDNIEMGLPPACVAACPMRVLDFIEIKGTEEEFSGIPLWETPGNEHPFPLPVYSRTQPHFLLKPHKAMQNELGKKVTNREEFMPQRAKSELPLVWFSLFVQLAAGTSWTSQWIFRPFRFLVESYSILSHQISVLLVGAFLGMGLLISFAHLGRKRNAWRMLGNLKKSWLSKEILFLGLFSFGWTFSILTKSNEINLLTAIAGFALVYSMANVYKLRSMAIWNSWRTLVAFFLSTLLLGQFLLMPVLLYGYRLNGIVVPSGYVNSIGYISVVLLATELGLILLTVGIHRSNKTVLRIVIILLAIAGTILAAFTVDIVRIWAYGFLFMLVFLEEWLSRLMFYGELEQRVL